MFLKWIIFICYFFFSVFTMFCQLCSNCFVNNCNARVFFFFSFSRCFFLDFEYELWIWSIPTVFWNANFDSTTVWNVDQLNLFKNRFQLTLLSPDTNTYRFISHKVIQIVHSVSLIECRVQKACVSWLWDD